jgi:methionyl aminopeptidase
VYSNKLGNPSFSFILKFATLLHMSVRLKTAKEMEVIKKGGMILAQVLAAVAKKVDVGVHTKDLDELAEKLIREAGGSPAFKGYAGPINSYAHTLCTSVNEAVVHEPPEPGHTLHEGDIVGLDIGMRYPAKDGFYTDTALTMPVGKISAKTAKLLADTKEALMMGVKAIKVDGDIKDIGRAIEKFLKPKKYGIVKDLVGHGVGYAVHEDPQIPNYDDPASESLIIKPGLVIAIEPMVNLGQDKVVFEKDGWTVTTKDKSLSAHFEVTVIVTDKGVEVVTPLL